MQREKATQQKVKARDIGETKERDQIGNISSCTLTALRNRISQILVAVWGNCACEITQLLRLLPSLYPSTTVPCFFLFTPLFSLSVMGVGHLRVQKKGEKDKKRTEKPDLS